MDVWRFVIPVLVIGAAVIAAVVANRYRTPMHPEIDVTGLGDRPGIVLFSSVDCSNCKATIANLKEAGLPYREVTHELEGQRFEEQGVIAVPLTVFVTEDGSTSAILPGVPKVRTLKSEARRIGVTPT